MFWHQRSRIKWLQMGDKNPRFFHPSTIHRRQRNQIVKLQNAAGNWKTEPKEISGIIKSHFHSLFNYPPAREFDDLLSLIDPCVTTDINCALIKPVTHEETHLAVFQLGPLKAPDSDGFPGIFFQNHWDVVGNDIFEAVSSFFHTGIVAKEFNHTNVTLIPKVSFPSSMSQFCPISLCRFAYKIISKILTNGLQPFFSWSDFRTAVSLYSWSPNSR